MSKIALSPDGGGTGTFTLASPNSNTNRTLTLPDAAGELLTTTGSGANLTGVDSFKPVAVTGTTPSLDLGSYNYFDNGTLTGNTTISFASVPTNAKWDYTFKSVTLVGAWDVTLASFSRSFSVSAQETGTSGVFFKPDGTKMYVCGYTGDDVNEYNLGTAWDVATAVFLQVFSVAAQEAQPTGLFFKPDGTKMYIVGRVGDEINEYNLGTAWDVSTAVFLQLFSVNAQGISPQDLFFKPDGTKVYVVESASSQSVNEYNLSTAWNISTAVYSQLFSVAGQETAPTDVFFKPDGTKMYVVGSTGDDVNEYDLSTAWDVSTAVFLQLFSVVDQDNVPSGIFFKPDGLRVYLCGLNSNSIYEYSLGTPTTMTLPAALQNSPRLPLENDSIVTYGFVTMDGGTTVKLISEEVL